MEATNVQTIIKETEDKMKKAVEVVNRELSTVRTGRASPGLVEHIKIDYYGTHTPLKQLASISTPDAKLIVIQPWDPSSMPEIEKALLKSELGISPVNDGKLIRLAIPQLTQERREELAKLVKKMTEEGRVSIRSVRRDANEHIKKIEKDKNITEDESFKGIGDVQKLTDKYIAKIEEVLKTKEKELAEV